MEFRSGGTVSSDDAEHLFEALIGSENVNRIVELLEAWDIKGTTTHELFTFASLMQRRMKSIDVGGEKCVDIVGTGGSHSKTFNVSTAAAFVVSGTGLPVAKHGNRAATSRSGSFDCLSLLGVDADVEPELSQKCFDEIGLCFMFAPRFHALSRPLSEARRIFGRPSIFNSLGPLCNPASTQHQIMGVWKADLISTTANALAQLGTKRSWIVHGENGLDEIALVGETLVGDVKDDGFETFKITTKDFGVDKTAGDLPSNCSAEESASLIKEILNDRKRLDAAEKLVLINSAAAIYVAGFASDLQSAYSMGEESLRSGAALRKLTQLSEITKQ